MTQMQTSQAGTQAATQWKLLDWDRTVVVAGAWDQLKEVLLNAPRKASIPNTIVDLISPHGDVLSIGIAGPLDRDNPGLSEPLACLNFTAASRNPPYLTAVGDPSLSRENGGAIVFRYEEGTWTEIPRRNCVPVETMLRVAKHFFHNGSLPNWITWEEV